jgi:hypothetical protein
MRQIPPRLPRRPPPPPAPVPSRSPSGVAHYSRHVSSCAVLCCAVLCCALRFASFSAALCAVHPSNLVIATSSFLEFITLVATYRS